MLFMATAERWDDIVALVSQRGFATVGELSRLCDVSEVTVRRDLQALHDQGRLQRTYGGAAALQAGGHAGKIPSEQQAEGFLAGRFDALIATPVSPTLERVLLDRAASRKVPIIAKSLGIAGSADGRGRGQLSGRARSGPLGGGLCTPSP